jgi:hypothetical protein
MSVPVSVRVDALRCGDQVWDGRDWRTVIDMADYASASASAITFDPVAGGTGVDIEILDHAALVQVIPRNPFGVHELDRYLR